MGARWKPYLTLFTITLLTASLLIAPATADEHDEDPDDVPRLATFAEDLNNPRGLAIDTDGTIYVAEGGTGGDEICVPEPEEDGELCFGATARIVAIDTDGTVTTEVDGLPSIGVDEELGEFIGAADVAVAEDGSLYIAIGFGADSPQRDAVAEEWAPAALLGTIQHWDGDELTEIADLAAWETENDPDADEPSTQSEQGQESDHSNPNGLLITTDGDLLAVDAGGNAVLEIDVETGEISMVAFLPDRFVSPPPFLGMPPGAEFPMQAVPTNLAESADGTLLLTELTGFPFPVGGANLWELGDDTTPSVAYEGFTNAMDLAFVGDDLYVVEFAESGLLGAPQDGGALVRLRADGSRISLLGGELLFPAGVVADADGLLYVTTGSIGPPGSGAVVRFDPSQAADPQIQSACPPLLVPGIAFPDIAGTTHEEAITCAAWHGLFTGFEDGTFGPGSNITRGQFASTAARLIGATDAELATGPTGVFSDVDGTAHAEAINDLAAAGLVSGFGDDTYRPGANITRAQAVTILVGVYEHITETTVPAGDAAFTDIEGNVHASAIVAAAGMGWVRGTTATTFDPGSDIGRGQAASMLTRIGSDLVDGEHLELPS